MTTEKQDSTETRKDNFDLFIANAVRAILWFCMSLISGLYLNNGSFFPPIAITLTIAGFMVASFYGIKTAWFGFRSLLYPFKK